MKNAALLPLMCVVLVAGACQSTKAAAENSRRKALEYPVEVAAVQAQDVEYHVSAVGSVQAFERVPVTARVGGVVERVLFVEGDRVERGQVLAEIELERYLLAVQAAEAAQMRAEAALAEAQAGVARRESDKAKQMGLISEEELHTWRTRAQTLAAEARQAAVAVARARLDLRDARVRAPAAGVVQSRDVQTGQFLTPGAPLASLLRRDPLLLRFDIAEADAPRLHAGAAVHFRIRGVNRDFAAQVIHVAATADDATRMVGVTARVTDSQADALRPGAFAEVVAPVGRAPAAPVVPQTAVRPSEHGFLAYVVGDGVAHERHVRLGLRTGDGQVEVRDGLQAGEMLVVRGADALRDGVKVKRTAGANP